MWNSILCQAASVEIYSVSLCACRHQSLGITLVVRMCDQFFPGAENVGGFFGPPAARFFGESGTVGATVLMSLF